MGALSPYKKMKVKDFLKSNPDVQWAYFPDRQQEIIIRFWNDDQSEALALRAQQSCACGERTGRDKELSRLLQRLKLPYSIHMRRTGFFYLIQPNLYN